MAQGCILPVSVTDNDQIRESLHSPLAQRLLWDLGRALAHQDVVTYARNVTYPLSDPNHPAHGAFVETLLKNVVGNEVIQDSVRRILPLALTIIAQQTPDITGLVCGSGLGSTALTKNLAHKTKGDAFAYELTGTAELIRLNRDEGRGSISTNGGPALQIFDSDRLDLGVRLPVGREDWDGNRGPFSPAGTGANKSRNSYEADAFITRETGLFQEATIGIDYKHSRDGKSYAGDMDKTKSQLQAIANGLLANDEFKLAEFHFVTNGVFSPTFVAEVAKVNAIIVDARGGTPPIGLHEKHAFPLE